MKQDERSAGLPLPPAVTRRGGRSRRESHETSLVPPFKGALKFQPIIVQTRHAVAERAEVEIESVLTDPDVELPVAELDVQDLLAAAGLEIPSVEAPLVDEFTLSPEFEEATILNGLGDSGHVAEIVPVDVTILELGAFIEPPVVFEQEPIADEDAAAALAALAAEYDALEFDATIAEFDAPEFAPTAEIEAPEFDAPTAEHEAPEFEAPTVEEVSPPATAEPIDIPEATILEAVRSSGLAHHDLADRLQQLAQRLREQKPEELLPSLAQGDRFEVLIAGLLAGYLAARNE